MHLFHDALVSFAERWDISMIEIICNETGQMGGTVNVQPPKNIRQIGSPRGRHKIYIEDYVHTFLHPTIMTGTEQRRVAILLGKHEVSQDIRYTFISGAVSCNEDVLGEEGILFDEDCWHYIYKEIKQYFENQEIVGWFLEVNGLPLELTSTIEAAHRKYFAGRDKVLLLSEQEEQEDVFFSHEQGVLQKKEGYYIYYEKNIAMQEYMISIREKNRQKAGGIESLGLEEKIDYVEEINSEEEIKYNKNIFREEIPNTPAEEALRNYRSTLKEKYRHTPERKMNILLYTAASAALVLLCVIGITTMDNYDKMREIEQVLAVIAQPEEETESEKGQSEATWPQETSVLIESVPGEVEPQITQNEDESIPPEETEVLPEEQETPSEETEVLTEEQETSSKETEASPEKQETPSEEPETTGGGEEVQQTGATANTYLEQGYYIVQPGDKLEIVCKNIYNTTAMLDKLCEANQIEDIDKIYAGQKLILP